MIIKFYIGGEMKRSFYLAKVNINENIFYNEFQKLIPQIGEALIEGNGIEFIAKKSSNIVWVFSKIKKVNMDDKEYITGVLNKIKKIQEEKKWNYKENESYPYKNELVTYESMFLYDSQKELLVFEEINEISKEKFVEIFPKLCYKINSTIGNLKVELYPKEIDVDKSINSLESITYAKFSIIPANYTAYDGFKKLDDRMKSEEMEELDITMRNLKQIKTNEGTLFYEALSMVKRGYGNFKIKGRDIISKKIKTIKSLDFIYHKSVDESLDEKEVLNECKKLITIDSRN